MKILIKESQLKLVEQEMVNEAYCDKTLIVKKFLDGNYMRGDFVKDDNGGKKTIGVFVKLTDKGLPTKDSAMFDDVFYRVQDQFKNIISDKNERDEFLKKAIKAWYDNKINQRGNIVG